MNFVKNVHRERLAAVMDGVSRGAAELAMLLRPEKVSEESFREVDGQGTIQWFNSCHQLHRLDGPAVEFYGGHKEWYVNGELHRDDGPAIVWPDGSKFYYDHDLQHRVGGPAVELADGTREFWLNGACSC